MQRIFIFFHIHRLMSKNCKHHYIIPPRVFPHIYTSKIKAKNVYMGFKMKFVKDSNVLHEHE